MIRSKRNSGTITGGTIQLVRRCQDTRAPLSSAGGFVTLVTDGSRGGSAVMAQATLIFRQ